MIYQGKTYNGIKEVFDEALNIAKNRPNEAKDFFKTYAEHILQENPHCERLDEAIMIAKSNLGYFSGYYSSNVVNLIYKTYNAL